MTKHDDNNSADNDKTQNDEVRTDKVKTEKKVTTESDTLDSENKTTEYDTTKANKPKEENLSSTSDNDRQYDIVLYGATSYVGQLTAAYLQEFITNNESAKTVRWAIAGRNENKLNRVKKDIGNNELAVIIADSEDDASLDNMTKQTQVIITTVGPYMKYGEPLIKACANNGTDYVDLTGEALFIKDMMDNYNKVAEKSGARIVNACGFDSIPSDLGVLFTQKSASDAYGEYCETINMRIKTLKGGISGGTVASMASIFEEIADDKSRKKLLADPYILNDDDNVPQVRQDEINIPQWDAQNERWLAPFVMASINTRVVHRSNQLRGYEYGRTFKYDEAIWMSGDLKGRLISYGITAGVAGFAASMMFKPSRDLLNNHVLPQSGSGPSESERENGRFDLRFTGYTPKYHQIHTKVTGDKDPGYGGTCRMLAQSALCLAQDISHDEVSGGFWTPASAMAEQLIERLQAHTGIEFSKVAQ